MTAPAPVFREPDEDLRMPEWKRWLSRWCKACGAAPGQECDGSRIPRYEGFHFTRRAGA